MSLTITSAVNPVWASAEQTAINMDVTFEQFGDEVLPFTATATDPAAHGRELFANAIAGNYGEISPYVAPVPAPLTSDQLVAKFTGLIQFRLDNFARTRNYDSILSACTYVASTVPKFAAEGQYCVEVRDATWAAAYTILADVMQGLRPVPESLADIEAELPLLTWPV